MADYNLTSVASGAELDTAIGLAETAVQPGDLATVATTGAYSDLSGTPTLGTAAAQDATAFQAYDADTSKVDVAETFTGKKTLSGGYNESGALLTQSTGTLTIPLDGKVYKVVPSQAITTITLNPVPTAPLCSGCTVYFVQGATGYAVTFPSAWKWPNGMATPINTTANSITRLTLMSDYDGNIHADADVRSAV